METLLLLRPSLNVADDLSGVLEENPTEYSW